MGDVQKKVREGFERYKDVVHKTRLRPSSKQTYISDAGRFVRWLDGKFDPGSRIRDLEASQAKKVFLTRGWTVARLVTALVVGIAVFGKYYGWLWTEVESSDHLGLGWSFLAGAIAAIVGYYFTRYVIGAGVLYLLWRIAW